MAQSPFSFIYAALCVAFAAFAERVLPALISLLDVAFSPVEALRRVLREYWSAEPVVRAPMIARTRSFIARQLETIDFGRQPGVYAARC